ncbi:MULTISPECIES: PP2C family protein-serine/threonine phosphatase [Candidatus Cardinium]|uniref:PP2C family protein-serine/threonine phosphatase n=1 Tax=Candidatus Cardinium TaxID=273135 RepID=UPI001FAB04D0|nr:MULTISPECIES: PP2C family serine/threonine-protein phosphatase [Cardinium]
MFISSVYVAGRCIGCKPKPPSTDYSSNKLVSKDVNDALPSSLGRKIVKAYQYGDDALFVKAIGTDADSELHTNGFTIDVAFVGKSKRGLPCRHILKNQSKSRSMLLNSIKLIDNQKLILGVADGVGGWWRRGIDPGVYSSRLIEHIALSNGTTPLEMICDGYNKTDKVASSTICVATIDKRSLRWANLGDSGLRVIRKNKFVVKTEEQQYTFNHPYQLGRHSSNRPNDCDYGEYLLAKGDIVIMATDGLFDNLDDAELISLINVDETAKAIAQRLFNQALNNSLNETKTSPFGIRAKAWGITHQGGKKDDIAAVVVVIK